MTSAIIRSIRLEDVPAAAEVLTAAHTKPDGTVPPRFDNRRIYRRLLHDVAGVGDPLAPRYLVAELDGRVVATGAWAPSRSASRVCELLLGATHPDFRGCGIGGTLVSRRLTAAGSYLCHGGAITVSSRAVEFWARYGFKVVQRMPGDGPALMLLDVPPALAEAAA